MLVTQEEQLGLDQQGASYGKLCRGVRVMGVGLVLGEIRSRDERKGFPGSASRTIGMEESRRGCGERRGCGSGEAWSRASGSRKDPGLEGRGQGHSLPPRLPCTVWLVASAASPKNQIYSRFYANASDKKHRYFPQGAHTSQTKPLRKPNVQNKTIYTRLAPAPCPPSYPAGARDSQRVRVGSGKEASRGHRVSRPRPHPGCPDRTHTGLGGESGDVGHLGHGWGS